jgi:hypothetical protein
VRGRSNGREGSVKKSVLNEEKKKRVRLVLTRLARVHVNSMVVIIFRYYGERGDHHTQKKDKGRGGEKRASGPLCGEARATNIPLLCALPTDLERPHVSLTPRYVCVRERECVKESVVRVMVKKLV